MTIKPSTIVEGFKNQCCEDNSNNNELEWIDGDGLEWEEYICKTCKLCYTVPLTRVVHFEDAELVQSSLKDEIKPVYRFPLIKKGRLSHE